MKPVKKNKPELLLPVGNPEAFYAAIDGGADAIYLGLQNFNARNRAKNFTAWQVAAMVKEARSKGVKTYVTLNTVIRNTEILQLADTLYLLSQIKPDAVIVQDLGVVFLIRKFFPQLSLHASTQMAIHNSAGVNHAEKMGIKRVVLARELAQTELTQVASKSKAELEMFVHGALCYSFSGMCLFSSYLGGASANRGQCAQPCRRNYSQSKEEEYFFSLKDNQLIEHLPQLESLGIASLKVEGRLKTADYVSLVSKSYRMAIDHPAQREKAQQQLLFDLGREKTDYFFGKQVKEAITQASGTGLKLGLVSKVENGVITFQSEHRLEEGCRLRFRNQNDDDQNDFRAIGLISNHPEYAFPCDEKSIKTGMEVFLSRNNYKFPSKINTDNIKVNARFPQSKGNLLRSAIQHKKNTGKPETWIRIDSLQWLSFLKKEDFKGIIINLTRSELTELAGNFNKLNAFRNQIHFELPKFISENDLDFYKEFLLKAFNAGFRSFFLSHLSQKMLLPAGATFSTNENVYAFNDAAIKLLKGENVQHLIYPQENDIVNMGKGSHREGIVPLYFYPQLFYSRMPVKLEKEEKFKDKTGQTFRKLVRDGITIVVPEHPVSITQFKQKIERFGFYRYLIDVSFLEPSKDKLQQISLAFRKSEAIKPSSIFNFKRELK